MFNTSLTVSAPTSAGAGNWDCHVIFTGLDTYDNSFNSVQANHTVLLNNFNSSVTYSYDNMAPLLILSDAANVALSPISVTAAKQLAFTRNVGDCPGRLIGVAVEVHNTTSMLDKQGRVVVARHPTIRGGHGTLTYVDSSVTPCNVTNMITRYMQRIPTTAGEVRSIPDSGEWEAREGVYFVPRMNSEHMEVSDSVRNCSVTWLESAITHIAGGIWTTYSYCPSSGLEDSYAGAKVPSVLAPNVSSFSPTSAFFTGLSNSTTLTVTFRAIVEYFPPVGSQLLMNATPSAFYDPSVLAAYNATIQHAPYAVPVKQNAAGDYFRKILKCVSQVAPPIAAALKVGSPAGAMIVSSVGSLSGLASAGIKQRQQKRASKKQAARNLDVKVTRKVDRKQAGEGARPSK
jgi:hypothetical protein